MKLNADLGIMILINNIGGSMKDFIELMNTSKYDFLRNHERLGKRIILLGLGGSYAYGTNYEGSDIDFLYIVN